MKFKLHALLAGALMCLALQDGHAAAFDPTPDNAVHHIMIQPDGRILIGGWFTEVNGLGHIGIARLSAEGEVDTDYAPAVSGQVAHGILLANGSTVFVGDFNSFQSSGYDGIVRIDPAGTLDTAFVPHIINGIGRVNAVVEHDDGTFIIGGAFSGLSGQAHNNLARLDADGALDAGFTVGTDSEVNTLVLQADGGLLIGGDFGAIDGQAIAYLARLNPNGSLDNTFQPGIDGTVEDVLVQPDGAILVAGAFNQAGGQPRTGLARLNADGSLDASFAPQIVGVPWSRRLFATTLQDDGRIIIVGDLIAVNGESRRGVARLNADGSLDTSFADPQVENETPRVTSVALQSDGKVLIGGGFTDIAGFARPHLARLRADGDLDIDLYTVNTDAGPNGSLTPAGAQQVADGDTVGFTVLADPGFRLDGIDGCGGTLDGITYTTAPIVADCTVAATFVAGAVVHTVTPMAGANGQLLPDAPQSVEHGYTTSFTLETKTGYYLGAIEGCNGTLQDDTYTTGPILDNCAVTASFVAPAQIEILSGTPQVAMTNSVFPEQLALRVRDEEGAPMAGVLVEFVAPGAGASATLSQTTTVTDDNGRVGVFATANGVGGSYDIAANVGSLDTGFALGNEVPGEGSIDLRVTLSLEPPPACGTQTELMVPAGEMVNYCFTVTNETPVAQRWHSLFYDPLDAYFEANDDGQVFLAMDHEIAPGDSFRYNRVFTAGPRVYGGAAAQTPTFTWASKAGADTQEHVDAQIVGVDVGTPRLELSAESLSASAQSGSTTTASLSLLNDGDFDLSWSAQTPPASIGPISFQGNPATIGIDQMLGVPAYGFKYEQGVINQVQPIGVDAAWPYDFAYLSRACGFYLPPEFPDPCVGIHSGDFVGDDFSRLYVLDRYFDAEYSLSTVEIATGQYLEHIGFPAPVDPKLPPYTRWSGLAWDRTNDTLYASANTQGSSQPPYLDCDEPVSELYTIDTTTAAATLLATITITQNGEQTCIDDLAVSPDGLLFGIDLNSDALLAIDKDTGSATVMGPVGVDLISGSAIDFDDADGTLYLSAARNRNFGPEGGLFTLDTISGEATWIAPLPLHDPEADYGDFRAVAIARAPDHCSTAEPAPWLRLVSKHGTIAPGGEDAVQIEFSAADLAPGVYRSRFCLLSNDRIRSNKLIAVEFTVSENVDDIFTNGFELPSPTFAETRR